MDLTPIKCPNCGNETITYKQWHGDAWRTWTCPHCKSILRANGVSRAYLVLSFLLAFGAIMALVFARASVFYVTPVALIVCFINFVPLKFAAWKLGAGYYTFWEFPKEPTTKPQKPEGKLAPINPKKEV